MPEQHGHAAARGFGMGGVNALIAAHDIEIGRQLFGEVELHLVKRSEKWEKEFNHKAGSWMTPVVAFGANAGNKLVESVAFAPLLQAP